MRKQLQIKNEEAKFGKCDGGLVYYLIAIKVLLLISPVCLFQGRVD